MQAISAAPGGWRPTFVGGAGLGAGLDLFTLRKLQILRFWLSLIFPGVTILLVQGSPSGSSKSGGTHAGPGDAFDITLWLNGAPAPTGVYVITSLILRLLGCATWVRGQDVNADGVRDDSFAERHLHGVDREGSGKVQAAKDQIAQYLAHQNGLLGGRADYETLVRDPLWSTIYTDEAFRTRFMALTPLAASLAVHTEPEPVREDPDMWLTLKDYYRTFLGRDGTPAEIAGQLAYAEANNLTAGAMVPAIANSPEGLDYAVTYSYKTFMGRTAGATERAGWVATKDWLKIQRGVQASPEAKAYAASKA